MTDTPRPWWILPRRIWPEVLRLAADMLDPDSSWDAADVARVRDDLRQIARRVEELAP